MAKILPNLNLNRSPQQVQPYSLIFAKNIKLDETASSIIRDDNLTYSAITSYCKSKYGSNAKIVGCITTPREILSFIYIPNNTINIIRYNEDHRILNQIHTSLTYNNGEFIGTYNYNVRNELIIIFSEKNANKDIPLRTINIGEFIDYDDDDFVIDKTVSDISQYNICNDVPIAKCFADIIEGITIPSGTYNFFIRYKVNDVYTSWFPIGKTYFAVKLEDTIVYNMAKNEKVDKLSMNLANTNADCNYGFNLNISFSNKPSYINECQIGYILRHDNNFVGRIFGNYEITSSTLKVLFNALYIDEEPIINITRQSFNLYNVGNIVNYNNRTYISNYKENNNNVTFDVSNVKLRWKIRDISEGIKGINYNATLKPNEVYNFFIHFVRKDGSYTNGIRLENDNTNIVVIGNNTINLNDSIDTYYDSGVLDDYVDINDTKLNKIPVYKIYNNSEDNKFGYYINSKGHKLFKAPDVSKYLNRNEVGIISLEIQCPRSSIPSGFIGYFISYEKIESVLSYEAYCKDPVNENVVGSNLPTKLYKSYDVEIGDVSFNGALIKEEYSNKWIRITKSKLWASNIFDKTTGTHGGIEIETEHSIHTYNTRNQILIIDKDIYINENKTLYRLTDTFSISDLDSQQDDKYSDFNYPSFLNNTKFYLTSARIATNSSTKLFNLIWGDNFNVGTEDFYFGVETNLCGGWLYSNYNINCLSIKQKPSVVVVVPENDVDERKIVTYIEPAIISDAFEIKSDYLLSAGINTLINYSAYNKDYPTLEQFDNTVRRSDVFANESIENTWRNFGGENYKVISNTRGKIKKLIPLGKYFLIHLEQGLFVFDRDNKMKLQDKEIQLSTPDTFDLEAQEVYTSENGFLGLQDEDSTMVNSYGYTFYENDTKTIYNYDAGKLSIVSLSIQRLLENLNIKKVSMAFDGNNNRSLMCFFTTDNKSFTISYNYLTKSFVSLHDFVFNKCWNTKTIPYLRTVDNANLLVFTKQLYEDTYREANVLEKGIEHKFKQITDVDEQIFPLIADVYPDKVNNYSIVDIIFNEGYDVPKVLNAIKYILSEFKDNTNNIHQAEDALLLEYTGDYIMIYSDRCSTDYLDISTQANDIPYGGYNTKPWNDKGIWNYNYFRNILNTKFDSSDEKSLIYGKYFVVRFVFKPNTRFKLENLTCEINRY